MLYLNNDEDFSVTEMKCETHIRVKNANSKTKNLFLRILNAGLYTPKLTEATLHTDQLLTYHLHNAGEKFDDIANQVGAQEWIMEAKGICDDVYMVVGFKIFYNARIEKFHSCGKSTPAMTVVPTDQHFYAGRYRKVKFDFLSGNDLLHAKLEPEARWNVQWDVRASDFGDRDIVDTDCVDAELGVGY